MIHITAPVALLFDNLPWTKRGLTRATAECLAMLAGLPILSALGCTPTTHHRRTTMDLRSFFVNFRSINTASQLKAHLMLVAKGLRENGNETLAASFEKRLKHCPKEMDKESINVVLLLAAKEIGLE